MQETKLLMSQLVQIDSVISAKQLTFVKEKPFEMCMLNVVDILVNTVI